MLRKLAILAYSLSAYLVFLLSALWAISFFIGGPLPTSIDRGSVSPPVVAILVDLALLGVFAVQHTVMARDTFKLWSKRLIPEAAERSTYVLLASLLLLVVFWQWRPVQGTLWDVRSSPATTMLVAAYLLGWGVVFSSTFMVDHFDFFGVRRPYEAVVDRPHRPTSFQERWLYAWVRHPMMLGLLIVFWCAPRMTIGHLVFALASTAYIAVGVTLEERDLRRELGDVYRGYAARVPAIIPTSRSAILRRSAEAPPE